jgi:peptidoglycan/LPS O-acetylase OafA/YrhL
MPFRPDVEGMRAVAVGLVVAFHAGLAVVSGGYVGVDVFFVLSGFLITGLLVGELRRTGTVGLREFWARRARRLLPVSTLVLIVTAFAARVVLPPLDHGGVGSDLRAAALYFANWHYAAESTQYMADTDKSPLLHYWSLAVEEQFYLLWPLLLVFFVGRSRLARDHWPIALRRIVLVITVIGVGSFALSAFGATGSGPFAYFGLHTRAWELAVGAALALAGPALTRLPRLVAVLAGWTGLALIVASAFVLDELTRFPGTAAAVPVGGTALLIAAGASVSRAGAARLLSHPALRYVGRVSYAWYLWHWPALVLAGAAFGTAATGEGEPARASGWIMFAAAAVSFGLAAASHRLIEDPVRHSRWLSARGGRSLALGGSLTAVAAVTAIALLAPVAAPSGPPPVVAAAAAEDDVPVSVATSAPPGSVVLAGPVADRTQLSPQQARDDTPTSRSRGCYVGYKETKAADHCTFGDPDGDQVVVLLGDSHAEQWLPALDRLAKARHWRLYFWAKSACPINGATITRANGDAYPACSKYREDVLRTVEALPRVDAVLVGRIASMRARMVDADGHSVAREDREKAWEKGSLETFRRLTAVAEHVVVLRDVPRPPEDVPACLSESPDDLRACDFPRGPAVHQDDTLYKGERAAAATINGAEEADGKRVPPVSFVDLTDDVCPEDPCPAVTRDGTVMYRDDDHLAASFSLRMWGALGRELENVLPGSSGRRQTDG